MAKRVRALVVDDSAVMRDLVTKMLQTSPLIEVVATAEDAFVAREKIKTFKPDVLTLDVEMPGMNGIEFLEKIMRLRPMPVVMFSTTTFHGSRAALDAMEVGAFDFVAKPKMSSQSDIQTATNELVEKVLAAANVPAVKIENVRRLAKTQAAVVSNGLAESSKSSVRSDLSGSRLVAIGASTGGTEAIKAVLTALPENFPPIVIAQHIPAVFSKSFADRMDRICAMRVFEAEHNQPIEQGCVYIAPGDAHLIVKRRVAGLFCSLSDGEKVNRHRPSVEVLFDSVVEAVGAQSLGVMLTGMGADGAEAMLRMKQAGVHTMVQDEATSIVWGMPGACVSIGAECEVVPLGLVPQRLMALASKPSVRSTSKKA